MMREMLKDRFIIVLFIIFILILLASLYAGAGTGDLSQDVPGPTAISLYDFENEQPLTDEIKAASIDLVLNSSFSMRFIGEDEYTHVIGVDMYNSYGTYQKMPVVHILTKHRYNGTYYNVILDINANLNTGIAGGASTTYISGAPRLTDEEKKNAIDIVSRNETVRRLVINENSTKMAYVSLDCMDRGHIYPGVVIFDERRASVYPQYENETLSIYAAVDLEKGQVVFLNTNIMPSLGIS